jgi:arylformamidase
LKTPTPAVDGDWLDRQYNPRISVTNVPEIFALWESRSEISRQQLHKTAKIDLAYGSKNTQRLDVYYSTKQGLDTCHCPTLVFIHGGYWRMMDKRTFSFIADAYTSAGINVVMTNYSLCPSVGVADICLEQANALAWIYRNASDLALNKEKVFVSGHSAGGHLTAMMMAAQWPLIGKDLPTDMIKGGIALSGLFDLRLLAKAPFLKNDIRLNDSTAIKVSPALMEANFKTPVLLAVGGLESNEFHRQSFLLAQAWVPNIRAKLVVAAADHFTICDQFCDPADDLFKATLALLNGN